MDPVPTLLVDLDETLHFSEARHKTPAWNHIFEPFGYVWEKTSGAGNELSVIPETARPPRGVDPHNFIRHILESLHLRPGDLNGEALKRAGFSSENLELLLQLQGKEVLSEQKMSEMVGILENEWGVFLATTIRDRGVEAVPGAAEMIRRMSEAGCKIGVVTQAPRQYAVAVLETLGLLSPEKSYVDTIVTSEMVDSPKPHPEALVRANFNLRWPSVLRDEVNRGGKRLVPEERRQLADGLWRECVTNPAFKPVAYVGDSVSDVKAGVAYGIPVVVILHKDSNLDRLKEAGAALTIRSFDELTPARLQQEVFLGFRREAAVRDVSLLRQREGRMRESY